MKCFFGLILLFGFNQTGSGQNLLVNGTFDSDFSGWFAFSTLSHEPGDGASISGNGSMRNESDTNNNASFPAISDRFAVVPQHLYMTGVSFKVPLTSSVPRAWYWIVWYDDMQVEIGQSNDVTSVYDVEKNVWHDLTGLRQAPMNAAYGELRVYFQTNEPGTIDVPFGLWDDLFVFEETIFVNGFE